MFGGGTDGNERLTAQLGLVLLVLLAGIGVTIPLIGTLIAEHLFLGLLLLGPVAAKMGSSGYRFVRYYARDTAYRRKGPPPLVLRLIAPVVVASTTIVFITGVLLLFAGPSGRNPLLLLHKVSFIVWVAFTALHVLGHLRELPRSLRATDHSELSGALRKDASFTGDVLGRRLAVAGSVIAGVVIAVALIPQFAPWTARSATGHHHHHQPEALISHTRPPATPE